MVETKNLKTEAPESLIWEVSSDWLLFCTRDFTIEKTSRSLSELLNLEESPSKPSLGSIFTPGSRRKITRRLENYLCKYETNRDYNLPINTEVQLKTAPKTIWAQLISNPIRSEEGEIEGFICCARDITQRRLTEAKLRQAIVERDITMKETVHRVKNNFHMISSLINLQKCTAENDESISILSDLNNRLYSMILIHDDLYGHDIQRINLKNYLEDLILHIQESYITDENRIQIKTEIDNCLLTTKKAIPMGLIVNELVTNALKYAFPPPMEGTITIRCAKSSHNIELIIGDNGIGMPDDWEIRTDHSLGYNLILALKEQLKAQMARSDRVGTLFSFQIPV